MRRQLSELTGRALGFRRRAWLAGAAVAIVIVGLAPSAASALSWSAPFEIDSTGESFAPGETVGCAPTSFCAAVDEGGSVFVTSDPGGGASAWSGGKIAGAGQLNAVSCASSSLCVAGSNDGYAYVSTDPTGGPSTWKAVDLAHQPDSSSGIGGVSCPTTTFCAVAALIGNVYTSTDPAGGAAAWNGVAVDPQNDLGGISCPTPVFCTAVDYSGYAVTSSDPTGPAGAWTSTDIDGQNPLEGGVACASSSLCAAADPNGDILSSTAPPSGWKVAKVDDALIQGIACPATSLCVAVDGSGDALTSTDPSGGASAWSKADIDGSKPLDGVSCASATVCVAIDNDGDAVVSHAGSGPPTSAPRAAIDTASAAVSAGTRRTSVEVGCSGGGTCHGTLSLSARIKEKVRGHERQVTVTLARASYTVASGARRSVALKLSQAGLKALKHASGHRLRATASATVSGGHAVTRTLTLKLRT